MGFFFSLYKSIKRLLRGKKNKFGHLLVLKGLSKEEVPSTCDQMAKLSMLLNYPS